MQQLSRYITIRRRYVRSVNLERDLEVPDSIVGYIPTARALETTRRFLESFSSPRAVSAWTLTGVYGTGKSAFAHFLTALCSPTTERIHTNALQILREADSELCDSWTDKIPKEGLIRAVATAQRESIRTTIIKALLRGTQLFWQKKRGKKPGVLFELDKLRKKIGYGEKITDQKLIDIIQKVADSANNGILLIIDELGKSLESAALSQSVEDLYVLQQIAESFSTSGESRVFLFGLLHQSFADYAHGLSAAQRNEWAKIQGRFEDIPWIESPGQTIKVIGQAITNTTTNNLCSSIRKWSRIWLTVFKESNIFHGISSDNIASIYPFHPVAALALPILCSRYAQNDRTLFTFLASQEPHSFASFLNEYSFDNTKLPTLKLDRIYDYFIESAGMTISRRPNYQRWVEIQESILDAKHLDPDVFVALKTIGILNLISTSGPLRASLQLVAFALCDDPRNAKELSHWKKVVDVLVDKGFVTLRRQLDELRIWQGSDFDIEREIAEQTVTMTPSLSDLLNQHYPLAPVVARRHSYLTGTVRYFERQYFDRVANIKNSKCQEFESDGLICYWVGDKAELREVPAQTQDFRPLIVICARDLEALRLASNEYVALKRIQENAPQLRTDGVARNEVKQRLISAMRLLDQALSHSFDDSLTNFTYWIKGRQKKLDKNRYFNRLLSDISDHVYHKGLRLWNELINRRLLTSQGMQARRKLIEAMITNEGKERLGLVGNGSECSIFESLFAQTGIYRRNKDKWYFVNPNEKSDVYEVWKAIEDFCLSATDAPKSINMLIQILEAPPYGVKQGCIPVLLAAVLLSHSEDLTLYLDGAFIPVLGVEHFELLVRNPVRFSVKSLKMSGVNASIFKELQEGLFNSSYTRADKVWNATLLGVVKPLIAIVRKLPPYTLSTNRLSQEAISVRRALLTETEPDNLLFVALPQACGVVLSNADVTYDSQVARDFRQKLYKVLQEIQSAYSDLLMHCRELLHSAFALGSDLERLRGNLKVRTHYIKDRVLDPCLKSFVLAAANEEIDDTKWLEALLMVVADKPPRFWTDDDVLSFEARLSELVRRFTNLEALQDELSRAKLDGFDVRRVTLTLPDGKEMREVIWTELDQKDKINEIAEQILHDENLRYNEKLIKPVIISMIEKVLCRDNRKDDKSNTDLESQKEESEKVHD